MPCSANDFSGPVSKTTSSAMPRNAAVNISTTPEVILAKAASYKTKWLPVKHQFTKGINS